MHGYIHTYVQHILTYIQYTYACTNTCVHNIIYVLTYQGFGQEFPPTPALWLHSQPYEIVPLCPSHYS